MKPKCPICQCAMEFDAPLEKGFRELQPTNCPMKTFSGCVTRERALGEVLFNRNERKSFMQKIIYECSPAFRGLSLWLKNNCEHYYPTAYFPDRQMGEMVKGFRNENLESLTLEDESVDIWLHLDVMEHIFDPIQALREIFRTLKPGGGCYFTVPTYPGRVRSEQVAFRESDGSLRIVGEAEYHGNPQSAEGSIVTWRYGYDLPELINRQCGFDVEVRRWCSKSLGVVGPMTEVYICIKP